MSDNDLNLDPDLDLTKEQEEAFQAAILEEARTRQMYRDALATYEGRALLTHILKMCNPMQISNTYNTHEEFENRGIRRVGHNITKECLEYAPEDYFKLLKEMTLALGE